jgi:hypothetical protein
MSDIPFMQRFRVTEEEAYDAFNLVETELWRAGVLWQGSKLDKVKLRYRGDGFGSTKSDFRHIWNAAISDLGKYVRGEGDLDLPTEGYWLNGVITIPRHGLWLGRQAVIEDVIRHEFGHALADLYPMALSRGGTFRAAFGGSYASAAKPNESVPDWRTCCVSEYATTNTQEDFAETFMLFVKHKGKIPAKFARKPAIRKKWKAVAEIVKRVATATR